MVTALVIVLAAALVALTAPALAPVPVKAQRRS